VVLITGAYRLLISVFAHVWVVLGTGEEDISGAGGGSLDQVEKGGSGGAVSTGFAGPVALVEQIVIQRV
jgi:hypothetical protein